MIYTALEFVTLRMSGHGVWKYFGPILDKKVPPKDKELYSIHLGHYQRFAREGYS